MHALRPVHVVEARGMHVEPHIAVRGVDKHVVGPAAQLQMAVGFQFRGRPVVGHVVGANHVIAVVDHHVAGKGQRITGPLLVFRLPFHGSSGFRRRFRHGLWHQLLTGIVGQIAGQVRHNRQAGAFSAARLTLRRRCRIGQHLRGLCAHLQVTGGQQRDTY